MRNFERYCENYESIENYEKALADNFKGWCCHHRKGIYISKKELKALGLYYNRPAEELVFLTESEHRSLHSKGESHPMYGKHHSEESKKKMSDIKKGKRHTEETKKKLSELNSGEKTLFMVNIILKKLKRECQTLGTMISTFQLKQKIK